MVAKKTTKFLRGEPFFSAKSIAVDGRSFSKQCSNFSIKYKKSTHFRVPDDGKKHIVYDLHLCLAFDIY